MFGLSGNVKQEAAVQLTGHSASLVLLHSSTPNQEILIEMAAGLFCPDSPCTAIIARRVGDGSCRLFISQCTEESIHRGNQHQPPLLVHLHKTGDYHVTLMTMLMMVRNVE